MFQIVASLMIFTYDRNMFTVQATDPGSRGHLMQV